MPPPEFSERRYVAYYRVSTTRQTVDGHGLESQRQTVLRFLAKEGAPPPFAEFTEIESGRKTEEDRPQLRDALQLCRRRGATLVIARLDRLARNISLIARLMETRVPFVAADLPTANRFTLHILAAVAEYEADLISARWKAACRTMKNAGRKLGTAGRTPDAIATMIARGNEAKRRNIRDHAARTMPLIHELRSKGIDGYAALAKALNAAGAPTFVRRGGWCPEAVKRILAIHDPTYRPRRKPLRPEMRALVEVARQRQIKEAADQRALAIKPVVDELAQRGIRSAALIAAELTRRQMLTCRGKPEWAINSVSAMRARMLRLEQAAEAGG